MLKQRVITAIIMAAVALAIIFGLPPRGLALALAFVVLAALWEWSNLAGIGSRVLRAAYVLVGAALLWLVALWSELWQPDPALMQVRDVLGAGCLWWSLGLLWVMGYPGSAALWRPAAVRALMGLLILVPAWSALVYLRWNPLGITLILVLIGLVAAADIGAYFTGRAIGGAKLAPAVSPGKTWAGFWGGQAGALLFICLVWAMGLLPGIALPALLVVVVLCVLTSVLGDLLVSMVKRQRGVKDAGHLLPGHGGIMDRFDSLSAAAPVFALAALLLGW